MLIRSGIWAYPSGKGNFLGRGNSCNVFLIENSEGKILVDIGIQTGRKAKILEQQILADHHQFSDILAIIPTHGHADHINALSYFKHKYPHLQVWCAEKELTLLDKGDALKDQIQQVGRNLLGEIYPAPFPIVKLAAIFLDGKYKHHKVDRILHPQEMIGSGENQIQVLETPGHTLGHIALYLPQQRMLFSGDIIDPRYKNQPILNNANANFKQMWETLQRLQKLGFDAILPGHGEVLYSSQDGQDVSEMFSQAESHLKQALQAIIDQINQGVTRFSELKQIIDVNIWPFFFNQAMAYSVLCFLEEFHYCTYNPEQKAFFPTQGKLDFDAILQTLNT